MKKNILCVRKSHIVCRVFTIVLSFIGVLVWSASAKAIPLTATFNSFFEGDSFLSFTDGGITFSNLDERLPGPPPGHFSIERATKKLLGPTFSPPNYLTTEGFSPGPGVSFGRFGSTLITPNVSGTAASLDIFGFGGSPNILTLEALLNGTIVASNSISFGSVHNVMAWNLTVSNTQFDELKLVASGPEDKGVVFIGIDNVSIVPVPEPSTLYLFFLGIIAVFWYVKIFPAPKPASFVLGGFSTHTLAR